MVFPFWSDPITRRSRFAGVKPVLGYCTVVGEGRFELPASCSQSRRATKLRHSPWLYCQTDDGSALRGGRILSPNHGSVHEVSPPTGRLAEL